MSNLSQLLNQAVELHQAGKLDEAAVLYQRLTRQTPSNPDAWHLLGLVSAQKHDFPAAVLPIEKAVTLNPGIAEYHSNLANVYLELGRLEDALSSCKTALKLNPESADAFDICGNVFQALEEFELAVDCHRQAVKLAPDSADVLNDFANSLRKHGRLDDARQAHLRALELRPDWDLAINNYAATLLELGEMVEALQQYSQAIQCLKKQMAEPAQGQSDRTLKLRMATVLFNLGNAFRDYGETASAIQAYQQSLNFDAAFSKPRSNWIYLEQFLPGANPRRLFELHQEWDRVIVQALQSERMPFTHDRDPDRRLRLGILSPNFGLHPAAFLMVRGVEALPRDQFEVVCYSDRGKSDRFTERFQNRADEWKQVLGLPDASLAEIIRKDAIDILIVTSGHTGNNRLLVAARKPAPVQVAWTGDPAGISTMDGLIADRFIIPPENDEFHIEPVIRMPNGYATFDPPDDAPAIGPCPSSRNGYLTFGSFNQPIKYHDPLLELWTQLLNAVPDSRLLLIGTGMDHAENRIRDFFNQRGITNSRLELRDRMPRAELLASYNQIDVALDSFPFSGGITTLEALWMGVPVVSVPSETFAGRTSLTWLSNLQLDELIATSRTDYLQRVIALAQNEDAREQYRLRLRQRIEQSPVCDGSAFAAALSLELRKLWSSWCEISASHHSM